MSAGGWGRGWGTHWGGAGPEESQASSGFAGPLYPVPTGVPLGQVPLGRFSGEPQTGLLAGLAGGVFFSPALIQQSSSNGLDVAMVRVTAYASDRYERPQERSSRLFRFGPTGAVSGASRTNDALYRTQPREYTVIAVLVQTIPPGPTTVIKIP